MKKIFATIMALSMLLTLFAGCGAPAAPAEPPPESSSSEPEPEPVPSTVEGVVKEASLSKIVITLADGTNFALDTTGISDLKTKIGDTVKAEYTGAPGSAVASKVEVTAEAKEETPVEAAGVVKEVTASMMLLELEDGAELIMNTKDIEDLSAKVGDKVTAKYIKGENGAVAFSVEVTEAAAPEEAPAEDASSKASDAGNSANASSQASSAPATPAASSEAPASPSSGSGSSKSSGGSQSSGNSGNWMQDYVQWVLDHSNVTPSGDNEDIEEDPDESQPEPEPEPSEESGDVYEAIRLINTERVKAGLGELEIDDDLMAAAAIRAEEMVQKFAHVRPDGSSWDTVFAEIGIDTPHPHGENGGSGSTASKAVNGWMNSSGHRANILNGDVTRIGVGHSGSQWAMIIGG